jgi:hypothetical protein
MLRRARFAIASFSVLVLGCGAISCGSSSATHHDAGGGDAGTAGFQGGFTGTGNVLGTGGSGTGTAGSGGTTTGTGGTIVVVDAGPPMPTGSLVFQGNLATLLNQGPPCTGEEGATGDRWCAFFTQLGSSPADLYVFNATKAAAGTAITCGTTDANCLHLTDSFTQDSVHAALFQGDTLVYYDGTWTPFGWRPGMAAGRALATADPTTMDVLLCVPAPKGTAVMCLRDLPAAMQTDPNNIILSDLLAGKVDDAATPPLVRVDQVISANAADTKVSHFQIGFPIPGGDAIAWSSRATASGPEVLKMQTLGNDASRITVASGVNGWRVSPDGMRWSWLSGISDTTGAGTLQSAPYPAGASPTMIAANALAFDYPMLPSAASLLFVDMGKNLKVVGDPVGAPTTAQSIDTGVLGLIGVSSTGVIAYGKAAASTSSGTTFASMYVKKADGTGACTITSATDGYPPAFYITPDSTAVSWIQRGTSAILARYTRLSDCTSMTADSGVVWAQPLGIRGLLFIDGYDSASGTGALRMQTVGAGNTLSTDPLSMVSGEVGAFSTLVSAGTDIIVYTVNGGGNDDGVYVRGFGP